MTTPAHPLDGRGVAAAVAAYSLWGLFPAFWPLLAPAGPLEILAHRIGWTAVLLAFLLALLGRWRELAGMSRRSWLLITAAACLIAVNWGLYIVAVLVGHVVEAALGYFISPLVSVGLGVIVLRERLRTAQWVALGLAATAVAVIAVANGRMPWIALGLAGTFGLYGLIKKTVPVGAVAGVTAEGLVLGIPAITTALVLALTGHGTVVGYGTGHVLLLIAAGPVTAVPLLLYAFAARRIPLSTIGILMYVNPVLQFLWGVLVVHEEMPASRWIGFALVWAALVVFTVDLLRRSPRPAPAQRTAPDPV